VAIAQLIKESIDLVVHRMETCLFGTFPDTVNFMGRVLSELKLDCLIYDQSSKVHIGATHFFTQNELVFSINEGIGCICNSLCFHSLFL